MTTELDRIAKKNVTQKIDKTFKDLSKKEEKLRRESRKAPDFGSVTKIPTSIGNIHIGHKDPEVRKGLKKIKKVRKKVGKQKDRLDKHGVWSKDNKKGAVMGHYEKKKIIEKGFPSKAKMAGGGIALRGLGRAFMKGGKV
tara:strand:+ start:76 stop:495 length:420 start_codon:yes stop_codon:yes gene_type:complete